MLLIMLFWFSAGIKCASDGATAQPASTFDGASVDMLNEAAPSSYQPGGERKADQLVIKFFGMISFCINSTLVKVSFYFG